MPIRFFSHAHQPSSPYSRRPSSRALLSPAVQADVTSANIVGYNTTVMPGDTDFKAVAFTFTDIADKSKISLSNIKGEWESGDTIQIFDEDGNLDEMIKWKKKGSAYNWYYTEKSTSLAADHQFARGESVWFSTNSELPITISGQVNGEEKTLAILGETKFVQMGNFLPVPVKLSQLKFANEPESGDNLQIFDKKGNLFEMIKWKKKGSSYNWYYTEQSSALAADHVFAPGDVFWTSFNSENSVTFPTIEEATAE